MGPVLGIIPCTLYVPPFAHFCSCNSPRDSATYDRVKVVKDAGSRSQIRIGCYPYWAKGFLDMFLEIVDRYFEGLESENE